MIIFKILISALEPDVYILTDNQTVNVKVKRQYPDWKITQADRNFFDQKKPTKIYLCGLEIDPVSYDFVTVLPD